MVEDTYCFISLSFKAEQPVHQRSTGFHFTKQLEKHMKIRYRMSVWLSDAVQ